MSEDGNTNNNSVYKTPPSRNIGAGLSRLNLGTPGSRTSGPKSLGLTAPSRVLVSGTPLSAGRRTEGYRSAYDRLGLGINRSAPNVSTGNFTSSPLSGISRYRGGSGSDNSRDSPAERTNNQSGGSPYNGAGDASVNLQRRRNVEHTKYKDRTSPLRNKSGISEETEAEEIFVNFDATPNIQNASCINTTGVLRNTNVTQSETQRVNVRLTPSVDQPKVSYRSKGDNYNLEDDEEEVGQVSRLRSLKDREPDSGTSHHPDSGYNSPRTETSSTIVTRSRSLNSPGSNFARYHSDFRRGSDDPRDTLSQDSRLGQSPRLDQLTNSHPHPNPYLNSSANHQSSWNQTSVTKETELSPTYENSIDKNGALDVSDGKEKQTEKDNTSEVMSRQKSFDGAYDDRSRSDVARDTGGETTPVAKPRKKRKLTRRAISFKRLEDDEFIGFASLPEQVHRKAVRRGFEFTLMVVGETGLGKSTLINSLFLTDLYKDRKMGKIEERIQKTVELEKKELEIEERGVKLKLTIVDTPGFSDALNAEESWKAIENYIDKQFEAYFKAESGLNRKNIQDTRVHCCLYFISPYGHGLRPVDVLVMKKLHHKVNIVPLIAKSDMLTKQEVKRLKEKVLKEIEQHRIQIYQFPECDSDEDEDFKQQDAQLKKSIPFAVVGSNTVVEAGGKKIRGRMYPWGIVEVENPQHCDFIRLRQMLISTHMQDLKDVTCDNHYENYRAEHISEQLTTSTKERSKLKRDSAANLEAALDTDTLLQEKEAEIKRMQEMLVKMQAQLKNSNSPQRVGRVGQV